MRTVVFIQTNYHQTNAIRFVFYMILLFTITCLHIDLNTSSGVICNVRLVDGRVGPDYQKSNHNKTSKHHQINTTPNKTEKTKPSYSFEIIPFVF